MCIAPSAPSMPEPPKIPELPTPEAPPPPPSTVSTTPTTIRMGSQRAAKRQAARGPSALSIPMGGSAAPSPAAAQGGTSGQTKLNIGK